MPIPKQHLLIASLERAERHQTALALRAAHRRALRVVIVVHMEVVVHAAFVAEDGTQRTGR